MKRITLHGGPVDGKELRIPVAHREFFEVYFEKMLDGSYDFSPIFLDPPRDGGIRYAFDAMTGCFVFGGYSRHTS